MFLRHLSWLTVAEELALPKLLRFAITVVLLCIFLRFARYSPNVAALSCNSCIRKVTSCFSDEEAANQIRVIIDPCSVHATAVVHPSRPVTPASETQNGPAGNCLPPPLPHVAPAQSNLHVVLPPPPEVPGLATSQTNIPLSTQAFWPPSAPTRVRRRVRVHSPFKAS